MVDEQSWISSQHVWMELYKPCPVILIGTKADLIDEDHIGISHNTLREAMKQNDRISCTLITSSVTHINIKQIFEKAALIAVKSEFQPRSALISYSRRDYRNSKPNPPPVRVRDADYIDGYKSLFKESWFSDVKFIVLDTSRSEREILCHQLVLYCSLSKVMERIFNFSLTCKCEQNYTALMESPIWREFFGSVELEEFQLVICVNETVTYEVFLAMVEVIYYGSSDTLKKNIDDRKFLSDVKQMAKLFEFEHLEKVVEHYEEGFTNMFDNLSLIHFEQFSKSVKDKLFGKKSNADVVLNFGAYNIYCHKIILASNSEIFRKMFCGTFSEHNLQEINILEDEYWEESQTEMRMHEYNVMVEYLYSDVATFNATNVIGVLSLAHQYNISRLVSLCEVFIANSLKFIELDGLDSTYIDIFGILTVSQTFGANQLTKYCLYLMSTNYEIVSQQEEWNQLDQDTKSFIKHTKWIPKLAPPSSYDPSSNKQEKRQCRIQ